MTFLELELTKSVRSEFDLGMNTVLNIEQYSSVRRTRASRTELSVTCSPRDVLNKGDPSRSPSLLGVHTVLYTTVGLGCFHDLRYGSP